MAQDNLVGKFAYVIEWTKGRAPRTGMARASEPAALHRSQWPGFALFRHQGLKPLANFGPRHARKRVPGLKVRRYALLDEFWQWNLLMQSP